MKKVIKLVSLVLAITLSMLLPLTGCSNSNTQKKQATADASHAALALDKVELVAYLPGEAPPDGPAVMEEVNKKLEKDINATLKLEYIAVQDIAVKYPLVLASGQDWDFIYGNINYASNAAKGAYHEITMTDVEENMPLTFKATSREQWIDTLVNGKIYMIPQSFKELNVPTMFYREDLRKKYNTPEIKKAADFEPYLEAIKKNEGSIVPFDGTAYDISALFGAFQNDEYGYVMGINVNFSLVSFSLDDPSGKLVSFFDEEFAPSYIRAAEFMKRLYAKGLLPKNAFAQKTMGRDLFMTEKTTIWSNAFENYPQYSEDCKAKGWELGCLNLVSHQGTASLRPATGNGYALSPYSAKHERALMAIDLLNQEKSYNMLVSFGIEGRNYIMKGEKLALAPGIDPAKNPYPMYASGFWASNRDQWPELESYTQAYIDMKKSLLRHSKSHILLGFNCNTDSIKTEIVNCTNVTSQYGSVISLGMVKDVEAAFKMYKEKLLAAGAQKIVDESKKQAVEFMKAHSN